MKKVGILFSFLLLLSPSAFAQSNNETGIDNENVVLYCGIDGVLTGVQDLKATFWAIPNHIRQLTHPGLPTLTILDNQTKLLTSMQKQTRQDCDASYLQAITVASEVRQKLVSRQASTPTETSNRSTTHSAVSTQETY
jgi:hypothetical protein